MHSLDDNEGQSTGADNLSRPPVGMTWQRSQMPYCPCRAGRFRRSPSPLPPSTICRVDLQPDQARRVLGRRGGLSRRVRAAESAICSCIRSGSGPNAAASTLHSGGSRALPTPDYMRCGSCSPRNGLGEDKCSFARSTAERPSDTGCAGTGRTRDFERFLGGLRCPSRVKVRSTGNCASIGIGHKEQSSMIRRYIIWRNEDAAEENHARSRTRKHCLRRP